ncbi:hypothetical protein BJ968_002310 [Kineococcus aurantiacus]|uniref:Uncharacterized protein n=1 Tax=Kineococcus aurantiacus TaxID=37633 RepID=A0A7Y9DLK2_9ACTN|nr:hypothetical protein [Kineococcus aurantiacus]
MELDDGRQRFTWNIDVGSVEESHGRLGVAGRRRDVGGRSRLRHLDRFT